MKVLVLDSQVMPIEELGKREIQGLYHFENSCQSFWTLKAKIETAIFQRTLSEPNFQDHKKR